MLGGMNTKNSSWVEGKGPAEIGDAAVLVLAASYMQGPILQPSRRDLGVAGMVPGVETPGYYRAVPTGLPRSLHPATMGRPSRALATAAGGLTCRAVGACRMRPLVPWVSVRDCPELSRIVRGYLFIFFFGKGVPLGGLLAHACLDAGAC